MFLLALGTRFRNFQVQPCRTTTSISEVVFKLVLDPHRQQVRGPGILDTERLQTPHSPDMFHMILHIENVLQLNFSANKKQNLGGQNTHEVVVVANGSERRAQNPAPCHRMIASNLCYTHRPVNYHRVLVHLLQGLLACFHIIHTHQPNPAISRMMERLTRGSGGSHPRAHMRAPQHQQQPHCFPTPAAGCNTYASPVPVHVPKQRTDPYVYTQATTKAAPPLPAQLATRFAPGHWGTPAQMLESLQQTTGTAVETLRRKLQGCSSAGRQQQVTPAHNAPLPPPPPPPPAIPIPAATATQSTPLTTPLTAHTDANQQVSSAVLASSHGTSTILTTATWGFSTRNSTVAANSQQFVF